MTLQEVIDRFFQTINNALTHTLLQTTERAAREDQKILFHFTMRQKDTLKAYRDVKLLDKSLDQSLDQSVIESIDRLDLDWFFRCLVTGLFPELLTEAERADRLDREGADALTPDTIPLFLMQIRVTFKERWETLKAVDAEEVLELSLQSEWIFICNYFDQIAQRAFDKQLITKKQLEKVIPCFYDASGQRRTNEFELFFPVLDRYFLHGLEFYREVGWGLFWRPRTVDLDPATTTGRLLPVRLFTPVERTLLEFKYTQPGVPAQYHFRTYGKFFISSAHLPPPIKRNTYLILKQAMEEALLIDYHMTEETHPHLLEGLPLEEGLTALETAKDEAVAAHSEKFLRAYGEHSTWGGADERKVLDNQVIFFEPGNYFNHSTARSMALGDLFSQMAAEQPGTLPACLQAAWIHVLAFLAKYSPKEKFNVEIERNFRRQLASAREPVRLAGAKLTLFDIRPIDTRPNRGLSAESSDSATSSTKSANSWDDSSGPSNANDDEVPELEELFQLDDALSTRGAAAAANSPRTDSVKQPMRLFASVSSMPSQPLSSPPPGILDAAHTPPRKSPLGDSIKMERAQDVKKQKSGAGAEEPELDFRL